MTSVTSVDLPSDGEVEVCSVVDVSEKVDGSSVVLDSSSVVTVSWVLTSNDVVDCVSGGEVDV